MRTTTINITRGARLLAAKALRRRVRALQAPAKARHLNGRDITTALTTGTLVTISRVLASLGADADLIRRYASHAGKQVKAAALAAGAAPVAVWTVRNGIAIEVAAYAPDAPALRTGLASYPRTAHLIAA